MKRQPQMRTPDHTRLNLGQEKYYRPFIERYIKILQSNLKKVKHIGRKLVCECEMLQDNEKRRLMELERIFGVDFGAPGRRGLELV